MLVTEVRKSLGEYDTAGLQIGQWFLKFRGSSATFDALGPYDIKSFFLLILKG